jgi:predicted RNase H-like HicB family nuclease
MISREERMEKARVALTAVYLRSSDGYVGFIEELPGINSYGHTIDEARDMLRSLASVAFDAERHNAEELLQGLEIVREEFSLTLRG